MANAQEMVRVLDTLERECKEQIGSKWDNMTAIERLDAITNQIDNTKSKEE